MDGDEISMTAATSENITDESLQTPPTDIDEDPVGCYIDEQEIFLIQNNEVVVQQISQWLLVVVLPVTTIVFVYAGWQA